MSRLLLIFVLPACILQPARAALDTTRIDTSFVDGATVDGNIAAGEYNGYSYTGGMGNVSNFGGPLGNGTLHFESDAVNLYIGAEIAGSLGGNLITIFMDTRSGGFSSDSTMNDQGDDGRRVASKLTLNPQDNFPVTADFALQFGVGGDGNPFTTLFELTNSSLIPRPRVVQGNGGVTGAGVREVSIALSTLGAVSGGNVDFFAVLISHTQFSSSEGIPAPGFANNPGFGTAGSPVTWPNFNRFTTAAIPEVSPLLAIPVALVAASALTGGMRRRRSA